MKLFFHGAQYEYQPSDLPVTEGEVGGTYRGKPWKIHRCQEPRRCQPYTVEMLYRGIHYKKS